jgi:hypothetical protein
VILIRPVTQSNLVLAGSPAEIEEVVMDKGYHDNGLLARLTKAGLRTYVPERRQKRRCWTNKPAAYEPAFRANRRRVRSDKGRRLNRWRSERCERTFAHVCETGGGRRSWLRGILNVNKAHTLKCAAYNLGLLLRKAFGYRKPRNVEAAGAALFFVSWAILRGASAIAAPVTIAGWIVLLGMAGMILLFSTAARIALPVPMIRKTCLF